MEKYTDEAKSDAWDMVNEFSEKIAEYMVEEEELNPHEFDFNNIDGLDAYHHETHYNTEYTLLEAATLMDDLSEHIATDSGLWEGLEPRKAVAVQAAFTFGDAVMYYYSELMECICEDTEIVRMMEDYAEDETGETKDRVEDEIHSRILEILKEEKP